MLKSILDPLGFSLVVMSAIVIGYKKWWGWIFSICAAMVYGLIGYVVGLPFLIGLNVILMYIHIKNLRRWKKEAGKKMKVLACDICRSIEGVKGVDVPYAKTKDPEGIIYKHVDLCSEHLVTMIEMSFAKLTEGNKFSGKHHIDVSVCLGKELYDWVQKNHA